MPGMETWHESELIYTGTVFNVRTGTARLDNGALAHREVVEHPGGACILGFDGENVILIRQYRIAIGDYVIEAPAGKIEGDEDPAVRAAIELEEETGCHAGRVVPVGCILATVGFCTERIHLFLAFDLEHRGQRLEEDERIEVVRMPLSDVRAKLRAREFDDAKTVVLLYRLLDHLDTTD